jgi:hypothetical protein
VELKISRWKTIIIREEVNKMETKTAIQRSNETESLTRLANP